MTNKNRAIDVGKILGNSLKPTIGELLENAVSRASNRLASQSAEESILVTAQRLVDAGQECSWLLSKARTKAHEIAFMQLPRDERIKVMEAALTVRPNEKIDIERY